MLEEHLEEYNDMPHHAGMELELFDDAIQHVCRISRILSSSSHALLVGVGGSGKQSLARLAAFMNGLQVVSLTLTKGYGPSEFKADMAKMFLKVPSRKCIHSTLLGYLCVWM